MRAVLILIAVVLLLALAGWITFSKGPDRSSINVETEQIRTDANKAVQTGADLLHKAGDKLEKETSPQTPPPTAERPAEPVVR